MSDLFADTPGPRKKPPFEEKPRPHAPLATRMRPRSIEELAGQEHILKDGSLLRRMIESDRLSSMIFYGPPGTGKTSLAVIISNETHSLFETVNAAASNVAELRKILDRARRNENAATPLSRHAARGSGEPRSGQAARRTILFIDEIHRFSRSQQDVLMPDIEEGNPVLIGATIYNPFFAIVSPLLSRSVVFELRPLSVEAIGEILRRALDDKERGMGKYPVDMDPKAVEFLCQVSEGDARRALNALEVGILSTPQKNGRISYTVEVAEESIQKKAVRYDREGDEHYDHASAYIKSMRGSDPDAAVYYLAKMLYAGEDPRFIARRMVICAAEDVGNADPQALVVANAALQISEFIGMPEAKIPLAQATVYIACCPKSNASYMAVSKAMKDVAEGRSLEVPLHLKDASYRGAKKLGRGEDYKYAHSYEGHYVDQDYLTEKRRYYEPTDQGHERKFKEYLKALRSDARG